MISSDSGRLASVRRDAFRAGSNNASRAGAQPGRAPAVLLLDEPLSNLDALLREQMRVEIRRIQKTLGITAIYVTNDRVEAMSLSDRVVVMKEGVIQQVGRCRQIYERPDSQFVAGFVGKVAFFPVEVVDGASTGAGPIACTLNGKPVMAGSMAPGVGKTALLMARPNRSVSALPAKVPVTAPSRPTSISAPASRALSRRNTAKSSSRSTTHR